jgi:hypothetical protein
MNTEQLMKYYGELGFKLPPLVTVDGIAIEPGMTLWFFEYDRDQNEYMMFSYVVAAPHIAPHHSGKLVWSDAYNRQLTAAYSSKNAAIDGIVKKLLAERDELANRVVKWEAAKDK